MPVEPVHPDMYGAFSVGRRRRNQKVDGPRMCFTLPQRFLRVVGFENGAALLPSMVSARRVSMRLGTAAGIQNGGQIDLERRAPGRFAVHPDLATTLLDDSIHRNQPQTSPLSRSFRGEKGSKIWDWVSWSKL